MRIALYFAFAGAVTLLGMGAYRAAAFDDPMTIETIMQKAHTAPKGKVSLYKLVVDDKATQAQKDQLVDLYKDLAKNKPPKGSEDDWKKRCQALLAAAKDVAAGKARDTKSLQKAASCMSCHDAHKDE